MPQTERNALELHTLACEYCISPHETLEQELNHAKCSREPRSGAGAQRTQDLPIPGKAKSTLNGSPNFLKAALTSPFWPFFGSSGATPRKYYRLSKTGRRRATEVAHAWDEFSTAYAPVDPAH